jgi:hypothetical protein
LSPHVFKFHVSASPFVDDDAVFQFDEGGAGGFFVIAIGKKEEDLAAGGFDLGVAPLPDFAAVVEARLAAGFAEVLPGLICEKVSSET